MPKTIKTLTHTPEAVQFTVAFSTMVYKVALCTISPSPITLFYALIAINTCINAAFKLNDKDKMIKKEKNS